jgi:hypothetical protein
VIHCDKCAAKRAYVTRRRDGTDRARRRDQQFIAGKGECDDRYLQRRPELPRTQQLAAESDEVRGAIRRESAGVVGRLKAEAAAAQATEAALNQREPDLTHQFALVNGGDTRLESDPRC